MFSPEERSIYEFHDGTRQRRMDPAVIDRAFLKAMDGRDMDKDFHTVTRNDLDESIREVYEKNEVVPAAEALMAAARKAFGVVALDDEGGLTESETFNLLFDYVGWKEEKKGLSATSPNSSAPSDGAVADPSTTQLTTD